jgi:hypothetical protein
MVIKGRETATLLSIGWVVCSYKEGWEACVFLCGSIFTLYLSWAFLRILTAFKDRGSAEL